MPPPLAGADRGDAPAGRVRGSDSSSRPGAVWDSTSPSVDLASFLVCLRVMDLMVALEDNTDGGAEEAGLGWV